MLRVAHTSSSQLLADANAAEASKMIVLRWSSLLNEFA